MGSILSNIGLVISLMNHEYAVYNFDEHGIDVNKWPNAMEHPRVTSSVTCACRMTVVFLSVAAIGCLFIRQRYKTKWLNSYFNNVDSKDPSMVELINEDPETKFMDVESN